jgi:DNA-binding IclR family transcriptional regulator
MFKYQRERITVLRAFVEINKLQREAFGQHSSRDQNAIGIQAIIALGHLEGRPFNASNISDYLGIPRTTVIRKLRWLIEEGFIEQKGRTYYLAPKYMNLPDEVYTKLFDAIHRLNAELSKMNGRSSAEMVSISDSVHNGHKEPERQQ